MTDIPALKNTWCRRSAGGAHWASRTLVRYVEDTSGASAAEYAIILAVVAAALVGVLGEVISAVANGILKPVNAISGNP